MSRLVPILSVSPGDFADQAQLRRSLLSGLLASLRGAGTTDAAVAALRAHSDALLDLGLHDEAARLNAFARAVAADLRRFVDEADQLELAAVGK